mgnify:CR=1 FL=1
MARAADLVCGGLDDGPAIQAALDAGGTTSLSGSCVTTTPLVIRRDATLLTGGVIQTPGIQIRNARRVGLRDVEIRGATVGIQIDDSILITVDNVYVDSTDHGLRANSVAGLWVRGSHFNGHGQPGSYGLIIGASSQGFEAAWITDTLVETHYGGVRLGGSGNVRNLWLTNLTLDRVFVGLMVAPWATASVENVRVSNCWVGSATYGIYLSQVETTGVLNGLDLRGCTFVDVAQNLTVAGQVAYTASGFHEDHVSP